LKFKSPFYSRVPFRSISKSTAALETLDLPIVRIQTFRSSTIITADVYFAVGDDFSMGWIVPPPPLLYRPSLAKKKNSDATVGIKNKTASFHNGKQRVSRSYTSPGVVKIETPIA